ncbi:MAG: hypothetical protein M1825_004714 [Sarcosagium campestre]|nr:MAG: hypothetical protein M1825_004714 [Sarcosagium campestre]
MTTGSEQASLERELGLVSKVELKIALADNDAKLEKLLNVYLTPLLLKLASEHLAVRNKVISVCQHINTRIKPPIVQLPVAALLQQLKRSSQQLIRHFDLLYIQQGLDRIPAYERIALLPLISRGIGEFAPGDEQTAILFNIILKILPHFTPPRGTEEDDNLRPKFVQTTADAAFLSQKLGKFILFANLPTSTSTASSGTRSSAGVSAAEYDFFTLKNPETWATGCSPSLTQAKIAACRFLSTGVFLDEERFLPGLCASADTNSEISDLGVDLVKRASAHISLEDEPLLKDIFSLYVGDPNSKTPPVKTALRIKILAILSKSLKATTFVEKIVNIVTEGIAPAGTASAGVGQSSGLVSGRETTKFRRSLLSFVNWVSRMAADEHLKQMSPRIAYRLRDYIESQGWPDPHFDSDSTSSETEIRGFAYESLGLMAKSSAQDLLLEANLDLLRWLFTSLSSDSTSHQISVSIEEALGSVLQAFTSQLDDDVRSSLRSLLLQQMSLMPGDESPAGLPSRVQRSTRWSAVRFTNRVLHYSDVEARWIDILAIAGIPDEKGEVAEEGQKGLDPYWYRLLNPQDVDLALRHKNVEKYRFPDFEPAIHNFLDRLESSGNQKLGSNKSPSISIVKYCRIVLLNQALKNSAYEPEVDVDWERRTEAAVAANELARNVVRDYLRALFDKDENGTSRTPLLRFMSACFDGLLSKDPERLKCGEYLIEICALSTDAMTERLVFQAQTLVPSIHSNNGHERAVASQIFGILASHHAFPSGVRDALKTQLLEEAKAWKNAVGAEVNRCHGSILAYSYLASRLAFRRSETQLMWFGAFIGVLLEILATSKDKVLLEAVFVAIAQLSLSSILNPTQVQESCSSMLDKLVQHAKSGNDKAITALGTFAMTCGDIGEDPLQSDILERLYQLHELKQPEIQFTVGEALSCLAVGWDSKHLITALDVDRPPPKMRSRRKALPEILEKILRDCQLTKPSLRRACVIWLLSLVQYCGHLAAVQDRLRACQAAFKGFLSDRDELVQESASRGLTLVYQKGTKDLQDDLVRDLVASFTDTKPTFSGNVNEDTQLFEPGALPTGEGSISTYKDIMSLASEVGDPSLVYRFMSLASNNAIWSSRAAFGKFGLSSILSGSTYLSENPKLYAKLFRYRFDPNTNVQRSMNEIWSALVKDSPATIDKYFDAIMEDLLQSILAGREWRVRQASCAAIADLIQGQQFSRYQTFLGRIWTQSFKVLDDIKESVRTAAMSLCRVLTMTLVRAMESDSSSVKAEKMLGNVMPFLTSTSGIEASAKEVQVFALDTIFRISKTGNKALRPFVPHVVERLLGLLSSLEPEAVNYLHLNAAKYNLTEEKIDAARLQSIRGSPVMDAIDRCLDIIDESTMKSFIPHLLTAMKDGIGLPTKVGCSRVIVTLSTRHNFLFRPHADTLLRATEKSLLDRNDTVSSSHATAAGYLCRLATDSQILKICSFAKTLHFSGDDRKRIISGDIIRAISKYATDRFSSLAVEFLPFVFFAKHDSHEQVRELYRNTWDDHVGGSRAVMLYLDNIVALVQPHLDSASWAIKHTAALTIADAAKIGSKDMTLAQQYLIWPALNTAVSGKTWDQKHVVLQATLTFSRTSSLLQQNQKEVSGHMKKIFLREAGRNNVAYRPHAIEALGKFSEIYSEDLSAEVFEVIDPIMEQILDSSDDDDEDRMDIDGQPNGVPSKAGDSDVLAKALEASLRSIRPDLMQAGGSWPSPASLYFRRQLTDADLAARVTRILNHIEKSEAKPSKVVRTTTSDGVQGLVSRLRASRTKVSGIEWSGPQGLLVRLATFVRSAEARGASDGSAGVTSKSCISETEAKTILQLDI